MKEVGKLTKTGAVQLRRQGESILAQSRQKAREIEVAAHGEGKLIRHKAHDADFRPHYQTEDKPGHSSDLTVEVWRHATATGVRGGPLGNVDESTRSRKWR
jgi:hypothetical protein